MWAGPTCLYIYEVYFCYVYIFDTPIRTGALLTFYAIFSPQFCTFAISASFFIFSEGLIEHCQQIQVLKLFFRTAKSSPFFCFVFS